MALARIKNTETYTYSVDIHTMDDETLAQSMADYTDCCSRGIISATAYDAPQWIMSDEVRNNVTLDFQFNEVLFQKKHASRLGCTVVQYQQAMRVVVTCNFGYSLKELQIYATTMRQFAETLKIPDTVKKAHILRDLLEILPGDSLERMNILADLQDVVDSEEPKEKKQRLLPVYQSFFEFDLQLDLWWKSASQALRMVFFPVWFWWKFTSIMPLRPTECVLTPRHCITWKADNKPMIRIRRTKLKGAGRRSRYTIEEDYSIEEYPVTVEFAQQVEEYIRYTDPVYDSDIDVLFCKATQCAAFSSDKASNNHYSYANLSVCLARFYQDVLCNTLNFNVVKNVDKLGEQQIERLRLGDTRHIALLSLAVSGASPAIAQFLAGHADIEITSHYYSNVKTILKALAWRRVSVKTVPPKDTSGDEFLTSVLIKGVYCQSPRVAQGDFTDCTHAVDEYGNPGSCRYCKYRTDNYETIDQEEAYSADLEQTWTLLCNAIDLWRKDLKNMEAISCILDELKARSEMYMDWYTKAVISKQ